MGHAGCWILLTPALAPTSSETEIVRVAQLRALLTPQAGFDIRIGMATRWLPATLDALHRKCSTEGAAGFSMLGRRETAWFLQEALLEEQTLVPPDAERIRKIKALIKLVDHAG
jgi:hypothetical protein